jgi:FemAB-related protein (PEP-CTERM system-associated)
MPTELQTTGFEWPKSLPADQYPRLNAHSPEWLSALASGLQHTPYLLIQRNGTGTVTGLLPLLLVKSLTFGRFLVSLPYVNTGGLWAADEVTATALVSAACDLADQLDVRYLELRHEKAIEHPRLNLQRTDKVHMRLRLPKTLDELNRSFKSKLRSQLKKVDSQPFEITWGSIDHLPDFYGVFAQNMRDLGTPVFSKQLFHSILAEFSDRAEICVVRLRKTPLAAALLIHQRGVTEVPSASSLRPFNHTGVNMWMYHHLLARAITKGSGIFDFGRSTQESNTFRFKAQWNAAASPSVWQYYVRRGSIDEMRPDSAKNQRLIQIWKRLPVWLTRWLGPPIVRGIP